MLCFKLPLSICKRLHGNIARFWWADDMDKKTICWTSQSHLFKTKEQGGLDFRDLSLVNDALLTKQFWRILENPTSLVSVTLKAKYSRNSDFFQFAISEQSFCSMESHLDRWNEYERFNISDPNRLRWIPKQDGVFPTRSAYLKLKECKDCELSYGRGECSDKSKIGGFWNKVWRIKMHNKVKVVINNLKT